MAAADYDEIKRELSPPSAVQWLSNQFLERWTKICQRNAPVELANPAEGQIPVKVTPSETLGAQLWLDADDLPIPPDTGELIEETFCHNGAAAERWIKVYPAPTESEE